MRFLLEAFGGRCWRDRRGTFAMEFAMCAPIFLALMFMIFEISYDLFLQEVLNSAVAVTARQMQTGATQSATPSSFNTSYLCPNGLGLLNCNNLYVRVEVINTSINNTCTDLYLATTGSLPVSSGVLQLGSFSGGTAATGIGNTLPVNASCDANSGQGYCNPSNGELVLLSAIYIGPSFLNGMVPGAQAYKYNGGYVRAQLATSAFQTENYAASQSRPRPC